MVEKGMAKILEFKRRESPIRDLIIMKLLSNVSYFAELLDREGYEQRIKSMNNIDLLIEYENRLSRIKQVESIEKMLN